MVSLLSFAVCFLPAIGTPGIFADATRLRGYTEANDTVIVENLPGSKYFSAQLFVSAVGTQETDKTHGYRHLLEHLIASGPKGDRDAILESNGCFLTAETYRDYTSISIDGPPDKLNLALSVLGEIVRDFAPSQEQVDHEKLILKEELAVTDPRFVLASKAWEGGFGTAGMDPYGSMEAMGAATADDIASVFKLQFAQGHFTLALSGPLELDKVVAQAKSILQAVERQKSKDEKWAERKSNPGEAFAELTPGEARAAFVPELREKDSLAIIAAGFALASQISGGRLIYTPTVRPGLAIISSPARGAIQQTISMITESDEGDLMTTGRSLLVGWLKSATTDPHQSAALRGALLNMDKNLTPESLLEDAVLMDSKQFRKGLEAWDSRMTVRVNER